MCPSSKVRYPDRVGAMLALSICLRRLSPQRAEQRVYFCPRCAGYHLTSRAKARAKASAA